MDARRIADYGMLSDRHSAALVSSGGSVDWLCFPRFDSPSVFGRLLDDEAGHWSIRPFEEGGTVTRQYLDGTLVLETTFSTAGGILVLTDALVLGSSEDPHQIAAGAPHTLARSVRCTRGSVQVRFELAARPEYGLVTPLLSRVDGSRVDGGVLMRGGATRLLLNSPVELELEDGTASGLFTLHDGHTMLFSLHWASLGTHQNVPWNQKEIAERISMTQSAWRRWSRMHQNYRGPWQEQVAHSGRVLHGLGYEPTGAIVAAATTSLPETVGGSRNWDYRYTWVRDARVYDGRALGRRLPRRSAAVLRFRDHGGGHVPAGARVADHVRRRWGARPDRARPPHLSGWRGSRPVRVGNAAWRQNQLDVYGELLATAARFSDQLHPPQSDPPQSDPPQSGPAQSGPAQSRSAQSRSAQSDPARDDPALGAFLRWMADTVVRVWREPDLGIWEIRGEPRHFLHSKLMCWVALDRALELGSDDRLGFDVRSQAVWASARE